MWWHESSRKQQEAALLLLPLLSPGSGYQACVEPPGFVWQLSRGRDSAERVLMKHLCSTMGELGSYWNHHRVCEFTPEDGSTKWFGFISHIAQFSTMTHMVLEVTQVMIVFFRVWLSHLSKCPEAQLCFWLSIGGAIVPFAIFFY